VTGHLLPTPRDLSNICSGKETKETEKTINSLFTSFAQFIDHDLSSTANGKDDEGLPIQCDCQSNPPNPYCLNILTPDMPDQTCILFPRSSDFYRWKNGCHQSRLIVKHIVYQMSYRLISCSRTSQSNQFIFGCFHDLWQWKTKGR
jgi:hypothetical protein